MHGAYASTARISDCGGGHRSLWPRGQSACVSLIADIDVGGSKRNVVVEFNRNGFAYTLDRKTVAAAFGFGRILRGIVGL